MQISFDYDSYLEHKPFFDAMALSMKKDGHRIGIISGVREKEYNFQNRLVDNKQLILSNLAFEPDFFHIWGENESIANGDLWKCQWLDQEDVYLHFDDDAASMKKYTDRWIVKVLNSGQPGKF